tara:strand:+ start:104 stop:475 length:372 start_codon:yes stop_codon:yes gene_type:complete
MGEKMNNKYTEYINNNTFGNKLGWIYDEDDEKYLPRENGQLFIFTNGDCLVNLEIWLDKEMGSEMFYKWLVKNTTKYGVGILGEETREDVSLTYQEITEKISEFRIEMDKRTTWEEENIGDVQ